MAIIFFKHIFIIFFYLQVNKKLGKIGKDFGSIKDVLGAYKGLIQLQLTYKLDVYKMAKGLLEYEGVIYKGK